MNAGIPLGQMDNAPLKLALPTPFTLANKIRELGQGCLLYKVDLSRAYRQLRSCPLGIHWQDSYYIDTAIPFGLRHGASACQRTTEAVASIANHDVGAAAYPYIDDTVGAAIPLTAPTHYAHILALMKRLGLMAQESKCSPPTTGLMWICVWYDTVAMTMAIAADKVNEAANWCTEFLGMDSVSHKFMERFLGKVFHAIKCSLGARRFTSRLLQQLHATSASGNLRAPISYEAKLDAAWLAAFLPRFNGSTLIKSTTADLVVEVDSCLKGGGGMRWCDTLGNFRVSYPPTFKLVTFQKSRLNALICLWQRDWTGRHVLIFSDNWAVVCALQTGRAQEPLIQACMREMWWIAALGLLRSP